MNKFFLFFLFLLIFNNVSGQEKKYSTKKLSISNNTYLCVMDKSTGFEFNKDTQRWGYIRLEVEDQKFILELDKRNYGIFYRFGKKTHNNIINSKCKQSKETQLIDCHGRLGDVNFNNKSNLITYSFNFGYSLDSQSVWKGNSLRPFISIGKCSLLNLKTK